MLRLARHLWFLSSIGLFLAADPTEAFAYPQWQLSSGAARCSTCHVSPGGGGLMTGYGRDAIGEELSTFEGSGEFLHGALELPSRLQLGGDLRGAFVTHDENEITGPRSAVFPMQADLYGRVLIWRSLSFSATGGVRGQQRPSQEFTPFQNYQPIYTSRLVSREHFFTWQPAALGYYVRAGRFFAPFGLRLAEHLTYVRRDLGFNTLEESYNVSGGYLTTPWELHVTAFAPDVLRHIGSREGGLTAYYERRILDQTAAVAAQSRLAFSDGATRLIGGAVAKYYWAMLRTMLLAEADLVHWWIDGGFGRNQFVGAAGVAVLPVRGVMLTVLGERNHEDLMVAPAAWNAGTAMLGWFPYPHVELQALGRLQFPGAGEAVKTVFVQLHYFL